MAVVGGVSGLGVLRLEQGILGRREKVRPKGKVTVILFHGPTHVLRGFLSFYSFSETAVALVVPTRTQC